MAWAIITIYISKCAKMNSQKLPETSKFYARCKKCDIEKALGGGYHPLGSPKIKQKWLNDNVAQNLKSTNVIDFVLNLREKIKISLAAANEIESNAKKKSKIYYDCKSQQDS